MKLVEKIKWRFKLHRNSFFFRLLKIKTRNTTGFEFVKLNFDNYSIQGAKPYWLNFKKVDFEHTKPITINNGYLVSKGITIDSTGTLHLESTVFQHEYLNLLKANHIVYLKKCYKKELVNNLIIPLAFYLDWNYYHWLMEAILRLSTQDKETLKKAKIVLNKPILNFQEESLKFLFDLSNEQIHCQQNKVLKASTILLAPFQHIRNSQTQRTNLYNPTVIQKVNALASSKAIKSNTAKKIIISRESATERRIANIHLLLEEFKDFELIQLENKTFEEQVNLFHNAEVIIATHGAGLTNLLWATQKLVLIELFPKERLIRDAFYFFQITSALKINHHVFIYDSVNRHQDCLINDELLSSISKIIKL
jgi:capsular polysaccharide biosynthesis protein